MEFWIKAAQLLLSLSILVVLHEFGHYIPARIFKTRVEKFYLFFNWKFSLFKKKIGETEWGIGWIPLGGYVKIAGMIDESMDKEQMAKPAQPWEFRSKPAWQRLIIMIGGVVVNLILGMVIYILVLFAWGEEQVASNDLQHGMSIHPFLERYDLKSGDNILELDGEKVMHVSDITKGLLLRGNRDLTVKRADGTIEHVQLPDDIDYKLFKSGSLPVSGIRYRSGYIKSLYAIKDSKNGEVEAGDYFLAIDNTTIDQVDLPSLKGSGHVVQIARGKDTMDVKLSAKEFESFVKTSPAFSSGMRTKDKIIEVNGRSIVYFDEVQNEIYKSRKKTATVKILRDKKELELTIKVPENGKIGFGNSEKKSVDKDAIKKVYYGFGSSIGEGISKGYWTFFDYGSQMKFLFTEKGASSMGGFGAIGNLFPPTWEWKAFWEVTALISIILAFMNILPIPALDGGHVVFLLYEMITGKEAPEKVLEVAQYIGFFLIIALVLYANGNDIYKALFG
jgi:regulator of sigma E protease